MKERVQTFGRFLSGMVLPNIGAFIAWGIITALFIGTGWLPNERLSSMVDPMIKYLLPILIGYTGGKAVAGQRGAVMGAIGTMGVIVGTNMPMFLGAMIVGPASGWVIKQFDKAVDGKIKEGFEMLVNNFSVGILGFIMAVLSFLAFGPVVEVIMKGLASGVQFFVDLNLLPLTSIFVEPAKILFLNNAINHGILSPMGIDQAANVGKSIFFLVEANPGPGLGLLLAYCIAGKGSAKTSAPGAVIIHFLGGIHEIYFPYVLMNPITLLSVIAGGASGVLTMSLLGGGLVSPASPGSIIAVLAMTPKGGYIGVIAGVLVAAIVTFITAVPLLRMFGKNSEGDGLEKAIAKKDEMKAKSKGVAAARTENRVAAGDVKKIVFACDAGMGSSAMGATVLRKKLKAAGIEDIKVEHASVSSIPDDAQIVVTHEALKERAMNSAPSARIILIKNFTQAPQYEELVEELTR